MAEIPDFYVVLTQDMHLAIVMREGVNEIHADSRGVFVWDNTFQRLHPPRVAPMQKSWAYPKIPGVNDNSSFYVLTTGVSVHSNVDREIVRYVDLAVTEGSEVSLSGRWLQPRLYNYRNNHWVQTLEDLGE